MVKRKRGVFEESGDRALLRQKKDVADRITQARKLLHRALKAAKGFERQRLGKRLTNARTQGNDGDVQRITKEIEILKVLDLGQVGEAHLRKTILKVKAFAESELLPEELKAEVEKPDMGEEDLKAWNNVLSGMFNMKPLKEAVGQIVAGLYTALGLPAPSGKQKANEAKQPEKEILKGNLKAAEVSKEKKSVPDQSKQVGTDGPAWDGFDSGDDQNSDILAEDDEMDSGSEEHIDYEDLDDEQLSRYDALLGGSSDEESFDEEEYKSKRGPSKPERLSLSLSPTPSPGPEREPELGSGSDSESISSPPPKVAKTTKSKPTPAKVGGSTFLPTLMGGYYEASDSGSDIEQDVLQNKPKKNRPGQMARQAIWEKKYGQRANHIKQGLPPVAERKTKDDGWDAKRGAKDGGRRGGAGGNRGGGRGGSGGAWKSERPAAATGENSMAVGERKKAGMGKKDDVGVLHPSWQAAKKAKEMKKSATFEGTKVVFD